MLGKWSRVASCATLVAGLTLGFAGNAVAAMVTINGTPTSLQGDSEVMISLRHQDHMWEAANGETYVVINSGEQNPDGSLQLYSTPDRGLSWFPGPRLPGSARNSFSDGYLDGDVLYLTYTNTAGAVVFTALQRQGTTAVATWKTLWSDTAFSSPGTIAMNPAMAVDATGTIWLAFVGQDVGQDLANGDYSIRMLRHSSPEEGWVDTGLTFGDVDRLSIERSARPVVTATGMGLVYAVHNQIFWASRENGWAFDSPWTNQLLFTSQADDQDPYASHFSVAADVRNNTHLAFTDNKRVGYFKRDATTGQWTAKWIRGSRGATYIQTSVVADEIVLAANVYDNIWTYRSVDGGLNFTVPYELMHPAEGNGVSYQGRMETASRTAGPMLLLQQYADNNTQRLLRFSVPLP